MEFQNWLKINIEFEETLLERIKKQFGSFHKKTKTKLEQINDLRVKINLKKV